MGIVFINKDDLPGPHLIDFVKRWRPYVLSMSSEKLIFIFKGQFPCSSYLFEGLGLLASSRKMEILFL